MFIQMRKSALLLMIAPALLAGCGGSGSQGTDKAVPHNTFYGVVLDGYLQGATVFADVNRNGIFDSGEPSDVTDSDGRYVLNVPPNVYNPPIIVDVPPTAIDAETGKPVGASYRLTAPDGHNSVITPITSMVRAVLDNYPGMGVTEAEKVIRSSLHLSDTYELYADYTVMTRPSSTSKDKWDRFIQESGRVHNIARIAAKALGLHWQSVRDQYAGNLPPDKVYKIHSLLGMQIIKQIAPIAEALPNDALIDLSAINIDVPAFSKEFIEAKLRQGDQGASKTLSKAISEGPLHLVPVRNSQSNYLHMRLADGGSNNLAQQTINGLSTVILPNLAETDSMSLRTLDSTAGPAGAPPFEGVLRFDPSSATEQISQGARSFYWRMIQLPTAGEAQRNFVDSSWLRDVTMLWPANAVAYKVLLNTNSGVLSYLNDPSQWRNGALPSVLQTCCNTQTGSELRVGDLGLRFGAESGITFGQGEIMLTSYGSGAAKVLDKRGQWVIVDGGYLPRYIALNIPKDYSAEKKDAAKEPLFSANDGLVAVALGQIAPAQYAMMWQVPRDRYIEMIAFNEAAFNALKANLKW